MAYQKHQSTNSEMLIDNRSRGTCTRGIFFPLNACAYLRQFGTSDRGIKLPEVKGRLIEPVIY